MDVLYYYEYLLMQKFKEGVILIEEPLKYRSDVYSGDAEKDSEQSGSEKLNRTPNLTLLIILVKKKEEKKIDKKLACCHLQLACQWYKYNKAVLAKYDYFSNDETIIVYSKYDFKVKYKRISSELWFLEGAIKQHPKRLLLFLNSELKSQKEPQVFNETLFSHYVHQNCIVEMHLDNIFLHREMVLPSELFRCTNVKILSLKNNLMTNLPPDIGRMCNLEHLILTNNLLTVKSIPQTLKFCSNLTHLYLDNNHFDALPGFLLGMHHLKSVRRHGNHNYFKSTFIWYHHELNDRVLKVNDEKKIIATIFHPPSLEMIAIQSVISSKENFFRPGYLPDTLQDFISHVYMQFSICGHCNAARPLTDLGYKVFTFKSPYCGNTCVPFQHWACSRECGEAIEVPARHAQQRATRLMDELYEQYITAVERDTKIVSSDRTQCVLF